MQNMQDGRPVIVTEPVMRPNHCALAPQTSRDPDGFIDTGVKLPGFQPRVYIAMSSFRELARRLGYISPEGQREALDQLGAYHDRVEQLEAELAEAHAALDAVAVLRKRGYTAGAGARSAGKSRQKKEVVA